MKFLKIFSVISLVLIVLCCCNAKEQVTDITNTTESSEEGPAMMAYDLGGINNEMNPKVEIKIKDYGTIQLALDPSQAPLTVENFLKLVNEGFYDGLTFHRIIKDFMIQGGDPEGNGTGGSGVEIKGEFKQNGVDNQISHKRGVISMARSQFPDSASSQFFICHKDSEFLDGAYAAFGVVTSGIEVVDKICDSVTPVDDNGTIEKPDQPIIEYIKEIK